MNDPEALATALNAAKRSTGELKGAKTKTKISQPGWINWEFWINSYTLLHVK